MSEDLDGLNLVELLDLLEPVTEPAPVSLMPQTVGWVFVVLGVLLLGAYLTRRTYVHLRDNAYRRAALVELAATGNDAARIATLLRRTALAAFPREAVAGLHGTDWLAFLDKTFSGSGFSDGPGQILLTAPYRQSETNANVTDLARDWIKTHRRESPQP